MLNVSHGQRRWDLVPRLGTSCEVVLGSGTSFRQFGVRIYCRHVPQATSDFCLCVKPICRLPLRVGRTQAARLSIFAVWSSGSNGWLVPTGAAQTVGRHQVLNCRWPACAWCHMLATRSHRPSTGRHITGHRMALGLAIASLALSLVQQVWSGPTSPTHHHHDCVTRQSTGPFRQGGS